MGTLTEDLEIVEKAINKMAGRIIEKEANRIDDLAHQNMTQSVLSRSIPKKAPSCFSLKDDLFPAAAPVVVLPAGEAAMLVRIAEVASEYERYRTWTAESELFRLAREWRQEWRNKRHTSTNNI